jgi:hypothetical protein
MTYFNSMWSIGYTGYVHYENLSTPTLWNHGILPSVAAAYGTQNFELQLTCKNHSDAGLQDVLNHLPDAWLPNFKYNHYQEPEDDLEGDAAGQAAYRANYTAAANVIRADGNRVSLPWLELAEYSIDPTTPSGTRALRVPSLYKPPDADFAGVLWSLFDYSTDDQPGFRTTYQPAAMASSVTQRVTAITNAMSTYFPGKPWGLMASAYTMEPFGGSYPLAQRQNQAEWLRQVYVQTRDAGAVTWAWYNVAFTSGTAAGEGRIEQVPETLAVFQTFP